MNLMPASLRRLVVSVMSVLVAPAAMGALKVGDPAPAVKPASWAQGEAVREFEGDKVYIVEFWATWCGPCVAVIPHINDVYKKHKDKGLVVIGQNLGEDAKTVRDFVKQMGAKMTYRVTVDDAAGTMGKKWLEAAGQTGIPCAFVVGKKGRIAYIGPPMAIEESLLEKLLAEPSSKPAGASASAADNAAAPSARATELAALAQSQIRAGKLDEAEATLAGLHEALADNFRHIGALLELDLLLARKQGDDAVQLSKLLGEDFASKPAVLAAVASRLVASPDATPAMLAAAEKIATPVSTTAGEGQSAALAALARIAFQRGDKTRAVDLQTKAVTAAPAAETAAAKAVLDSYQQGGQP